MRSCIRSNKSQFKRYILTLSMPLLIVVCLTTIYITNLFPALTLSLYELMIFATTIPVIVLLIQIAKGQIFTLLSFYSLIFLSEYIFGALAASLYFPLPSKQMLDSQTIIKALSVAFGGYLLFLVGYSINNVFNVPRTESHTGWFRCDTEYSYNIRYRFCLFTVALLLMGLGLVQVIQRVRAAGGIESFAQTAYQYRLGTFSEGLVQNAFITLVNMIATSTQGIIGILILLYLKRRFTPFEKFLLLGYVMLFFLIRFTKTFRAGIILSLVAFLALYNSERKLDLRKLALLVFILLIMLVVINYTHLYMYYLTAGWKYRDFVSTLGTLIAPHNHLQNLAEVLEAHSGSAQPLHGQAFLEDVFFFIPRFIWSDKAPSGEYGTGLVQRWAGLPDWYQMAITNVGELVAHFGYVGLFGMLLYGILYSYLESFSKGTIEYRSAYYCLLLPQLWPFIGMGLSSLSITLFSLAIFLATTRLLRLIARVRIRYVVSHTEGSRQKEFKLV